MKNRPWGAERMSRSVLWASVYIVHSESHVTTYTVTTCRDPSRYRGGTRIQNKPFTGEFKGFTADQRTDRRERIFLALKSSAAQHRPQVMLLTQLWCAVIMVHCRHSQISLSSHVVKSRRPKSAVTRRPTHGSHRAHSVNWTRHRDEDFVYQKYKTVLPCKLCQTHWMSTFFTISVFRFVSSS